MNDLNEISDSVSKSIDELETILKEMPQIDCPLNHSFTKNLYTRTILMPSGSLIVSKIHKTEHPFIVSKGVAYVKVNDGVWDRIEAPYLGITQPGTRRVLVIESDCIWSTMHVIEDDENPKGMDDDCMKSAIEKIENRIIEKHETDCLNKIQIQ